MRPSRSSAARAQSASSSTARHSGAGTIAYSAAYIVLLVWRNGNEATFLINVPGKTIADTEKLAKKVLSRL